MKRRKKRTQLDRIILGAAKQIRKQRLDFEREASKALSDALGFVVLVKIAKRPPEPTTLDMRRARRRSPAEVKADLLLQLAPVEGGRPLERPAEVASAPPLGKGKEDASVGEPIKRRRGSARKQGHLDELLS